MKSLFAKPLTLTQANDLVSRLHRHHKPCVGHRFSIGAFTAEGDLCGAVIVGRPVSRMIDQFAVAEVSRLVTDGTPNACSFLYSVAARAAKTMGYERIQTYILESELGTSLKASGWKLDCDCAGGGDWNVKSRGGRRTDQPQEKKQRWILDLNPKRSIKIELGSDKAHRAQYYEDEDF